MDIANYGQYKAEQELLNCGLSQESIARIKDTTVITRDGAQHVVPASQSFLDESSVAQATAQIRMESSSESLLAESLQRQMQDQAQMFARYKQFSEDRICSLERNLDAALTQLKEMMSMMATLKSNQQAQHYHERKAAQSNSCEIPANNAPQQVEQAETGETFPQAVPQRKATSDKPIDRNGVAPSEINVEKMFYCGNK